MKSKRIVARTSVILAAVPLFAMAAAAPSASAQDGRIVGGTAVPQGKYPFMASLKSRFGSHFCGGTLISKDHVLTASHCVSGKNAKSISVVVGSASLSGSGGTASKVTQILMHPSYNKPVQYAHDAALLKLTTPITGIAPIVVDADSSAGNPREAANYTLTTAGWGTTSEGGSCCPDQLREVDVPVVDDASCALAYGSSLHAASMLCAGVFGKDSCQGDSGGPLFDRTASPAIQLGTVSWGQGCARKEYPGVYGELNMPAIRDWIRTNAGV